MKKLLGSFVLAIACCMSTNAQSGSLKFSFHGVFECFETCVKGSPLEPLIGTAFSGSIVIPDSGVDLEPGDESLGYYGFDGDVAHFSVDTALQEFDVDKFSPITVTVHDCIIGSCNPKEDYVWIMIVTDNYIYNLYQGGYGEQLLESDAIPELGVYENLWAGFEIIEKDFSSSLYTGNEIMPLTVTAIPIPPAILLFLSGLMALALTPGKHGRLTAGASR